MYAIFEDGGRQYKVSTGDRIYVDVRDLGDGQDTLEFGQVLALGEGENARFGQPFVEGAKVVGQIDRELKGEKVDVIRYKPRKNIRVRKGHRQRHLQVTIQEIVG